MSCTTQVLECLQDWTTNTDNSTETDIIYLDFSKTFDTVSHKRLIYKLRQYGIKGKVLLWIQSFLEGRRQRVVLRSGHSLEKCQKWGSTRLNSRAITIFVICK